MITAAFEYARPGSVEEAQSLLNKFGDDAKVIAGGQSLIPLMRLRLSQPTALIDIQGIGELKQVRRDNGSVEIGALVRHVDIQRNAMLRETLPLLVEMANDVGDNQVRNLGTIGGVIAHGDAAGDYNALALMLDAEIVTNKRRHQAARFLPRHPDHRARARRGGHRGALPGLDRSIRVHKVPAQALRLGARRRGCAGDRFVVASRLRQPGADAASRHRCGIGAGRRSLSGGCGGAKRLRYRPDWRRPRHGRVQATPRRSAHRSDTAEGCHRRLKPDHTSRRVRPSMDDPPDR